MKNVFKVAVAAIAMVMAVATAGAQTTGTTPTMLKKGDQAGRLKLALGRSFGVGAVYQYNFTDRIRMDDSFTWFLPKTEGGGLTKTTVSSFELSVNGHYLFAVREGINVYPLAGLGYVNVTAKSDLGELGKFSASSYSFGVNLGGGADYFLSEKMILTAEAKYMTCAGGMFVVSAGVGFLF